MKSYPVKIPTLWQQASQGLLLGAVVVRVNLWLKGAAFSWPDTLPFMGFTALAVTIVYFFQPTVCGAQGLKVMTAWGFRRSLRWEQVTQVGFARLYLLQPSFKLVDDKGRSHWISRDTKDLKGLYEDALRFGGASHPLTRALRTPLYEV
jgi:hypothetical protein